MQTRHELINYCMALFHYNHSYSKITKAPPSDSSEGCSAWSMSSLMAVLPESPSPTCSAASSGPRDSQVPIEPSDARNQVFWSLINLFVVGLPMKEAAINEWELKNTKKAMEEMKKYESKVERKRSKALAKTNKRISRVKNEANRKKSKARRSTIDEISAVSKYYEKIRATKSFLLLKLRKFF
ncbi:hypothetical protein FH972_011138 [Carpinus fangiana]|uniref:Remorin C-terminal domain-containing protein n=1 Tax=Carpinus fangiana TaxID=176857 RepID=A0A660KQE8_9ROSI|nr:hypothetical protein FH972_011138 [Carpinus fangiana]